MPQPCRTDGVRAPASCVPHVPEAQGSSLRGATCRTPPARARESPRTVWCTTGARLLLLDDLFWSNLTPNPEPNPNQVLACFSSTIFWFLVTTFSDPGGQRRHLQPRPNPDPDPNPNPNPNP